MNHVVTQQKACRPKFASATSFFCILVTAVPLSSLSSPSVGEPPESRRDRVPLMGSIFSLPRNSEIVICIRFCMLNRSLYKTFSNENLQNCGASRYFGPCSLGARRLNVRFLCIFLKGLSQRVLCLCLHLGTRLTKLLKISTTST